MSFAPEQTEAALDGLGSGPAEALGVGLGPKSLGDGPAGWLGPVDGALDGALEGCGPWLGAALGTTLGALLERPVGAVLGDAENSPEAGPIVGAPDEQATASRTAPAISTGSRTVPAVGGRLGVTREA